MWEQQFKLVVVICGHQRSGTTLMAYLFQSHPKVALGMETEVFSFLDHGLVYYCLRSLVRIYRRGRLPWLPSALEPGFLSKKLLKIYLLGGFFTSLLSQGKGKVTAERIEKALRGLNPGAQLVGDKYPDYVFQIDKYARIPGVKCIVMVRDARDVAASTKESVPRWNARWTKVLDTPAKLARRWSKTIQIAARNDEKVMAVRYEELVRDPKAVMARVAAWLGVDADGFVLDKVHADSVGSYKTRLTPDEIAEVERIAGPEMKSLGYL